jgi:pimeloyl-ACP methyl ester carboxylesterase
MNDVPSLNTQPELELIHVARAENQPEAEFLRNLLLEEHVPSVLRRTPGFDVPDFLAAGRRDVLVPPAYAQVARDVLLQGDPEPHAAHLKVSDPPLRIVTGLSTGTAFGAIIVWLGTGMML